MKKLICMTMFAAQAMALAAAPAAKLDPVAEGYPVWKGLSSKSHVMGRVICPSDLRHKATVFVVLGPDAKLQDQLVLIGGLAVQTGLSAGGVGLPWEQRELPRNMIVAVCFSGTEKDRETLKAALAAKVADQKIAQSLNVFKGLGCSVYDGLTFDGAPDPAGKLPYVCVMGPEGTEPLYKGQLTTASVKDVNAAIAKAKKAIAEWTNPWRPFYGNVAEPKFHPQLAKALGKGKPLAPVAQAILKDVLSKDPERAKEAQTLYDALEQTRSDLRLRIMMESSACPHRAIYDFHELVKYWPSEKKDLETVTMKLKAMPDAETLAKYFTKLREWQSPEFSCKNAGEVKKNLAELQKMKKTLEKLKESKTMAVQNGAMLMGVAVDELIETMPTKVPSK